jgi:hypothetical protein
MCRSFGTHRVHRASLVPFEPTHYDKSIYLRNSLVETPSNKVTKGFPCKILWQNGCPNTKLPQPNGGNFIGKRRGHMTPPSPIVPAMPCPSVGSMIVDWDFCVTQVVVPPHPTGRHAHFFKGLWSRRFSRSTKKSIHSRRKSCYLQPRQSSDVNGQTPFLDNLPVLPVHRMAIDS